MPRARTPIITGTDGPDVLMGTRFADTISSGLGADVIDGRNGNDVIWADISFIGQPNNDIVFGGRGNDKIAVGSGADVVDGGPGDDDITLSVGGMLIPFIPADGADTVLFRYNGRGGLGIGHDTVHVVQQGDVLAFLDATGRTDTLSELADQTRLVDIGYNAYRIEWLKGDQSVTLYLDNAYLNFSAPPEDQVNWDTFTTLDDLATVVVFQFHSEFV